MPKDLNGIIYPSTTITSATTTNGTGKDFGSQAIPKGGVGKFWARVTLNSGTSPTATISIQSSPDNSTYTTIGTLPVVSGSAGTYTVSGEFANADVEWLRASIVTGGTSPNVTVEVGVHAAVTQ